MNKSPSKIKINCVQKDDEWNIIGIWWKDDEWLFCFHTKQEVIQNIENSSLIYIVNNDIEIQVVDGPSWKYLCTTKDKNKNNLDSLPECLE